MGIVPNYFLVFELCIQYAIKSQREAINQVIEEAILEADAKGIKVVSLGLLNQARSYIFVLNILLTFQNMNSS